jgi:hypothetical protein
MNSEGCKLWVEVWINIDPNKTPQHLLLLYRHNVLILTDFLEGSFDKLINKFKVFHETPAFIASVILFYFMAVESSPHPQT